METTRDLIQGYVDAFEAAESRRYAIPAAVFFEINDGKIYRVTSYYSLKGWIEAIDSR